MDPRGVSEWWETILLTKFQHLIGSMGVDDNRLLWYEEIRQVEEFLTK
jgi:hypothetical protein